MTSSSTPGLPVNEEEWIARLKEAAETGQPVDLAPAEDLEPADGATWGPDVHIPAAALRQVLTSRDLHVDSRGLVIRGARFTEPLDLEFVVFHNPLYLIECSVEATLDITGAKLLALSLQGTHVRGVHMDWSEIMGPMLALDGFRVDGEMCARGARIRGPLVLSGAKLRSPNGTALILAGAQIAGDVLARDGFEADGAINALGATITGQLGLSGAKLRNPNGHALILDRAQIAGDVFADEEFEADGEIRAVGATITGQLGLSGAKLRNPNGYALVLAGAQIAGDVFADEEFEADGEIRAVGATISNLILSGAKLRNPNGHALVLDGAQIAGDVVAGAGFEADGKIRAVGATITGHVGLSGAKLRNPNGDALLLDGAQIAGPVFADEEFEADGAINALGATITGQLVLSGAKLRNPNGHALVLAGAQIAGDVVAGAGFEADGEIRAVRATINGQIELRGAKLHNPNGNALVLDGAQIAGPVFAGAGFEANGEIRAVGATINGQIELRGAKLHNPNGNALNIQTTRVSALVLAPTEVEGSIDLYRAVIDDLVTEGQPPPAVATGWVIGDIHGPLRHDWRATRRWLNTEPPSTERPNPRRREKAPISVQPWHALADVYERNGDPAAARRLRFSAANRVTAQSRLPTKIVRGIYCGLVGNGYYPLLAILWLVVVVAIGCAIATINREDIVPVRAQEATAAVKTQAAETGAKPDAWLPVTAETPCEAHPDYPCTNSFAFTVNSILPPASATNGSDWVVAPDATIVLTVGMPMLKLASWALAALLLTGVTGLLRKT